MKCGLFLTSKNKGCIIKALDGRTKRTMTRVVGNRDAETVRRLYTKLITIVYSILMTRGRIDDDTAK